VGGPDRCGLDTLLGLTCVDHLGKSTLFLGEECVLDVRENRFHKTL
jgi:hypothetical protein